MTDILNDDNIFTLVITAGTAVMGNFALNFARKGKKQSPQKVVMSGIEVGLTQLVSRVLEEQYEYKNAGTAVSAVNHIFIKNKSPGDAAADIATTELYMNFGDFIYQNFIKKEEEAAAAATA